MQVRKTWIAGFCIFFYLCASFYALLSGLSSLGEGKEYPYLYPALGMLIAFGVVFCFILLSYLCARLHFLERISRHTGAINALEWGLGALVLTASFAVRVWAIQQFPVQPDSSYKTYYEIAQLMNSGTLLRDGAGYCDYISLFPHVYNYSAVLAFIMHLFGSSVFVCQIFNVACGVFTCFFVWRCAIRLAGRAAGFFSLIFTAFWPSQILYNNFLSPEYLFSMLLFLCLWLFLCMAQIDLSEGKAQPWLFAGHFALGILIGLAYTIQFEAAFLLLAIFLILIFCKSVLPILPYNDLPVTTRAMARGWIRFLLILSAFLFTISFSNRCVSYAIDRDIASGGASFGYDLMVGLNQDTDGSWNQEDSDYLSNAFAETGSAQQAQAACLGIAMQRLKASPASVCNLLLHKYADLWGNDDYGTAQNLLFLEQQGTLTPKRQSLLNNLQDFGNCYYLAIITLAALGVFLLIQFPGSWAYVPITVFLGTVSMHLLVENQNRYHFHALYLFAMLAAVSLRLLYEFCDDFIVHGQAARTLAKQQKAQEQAAYRRIEQAQAYAQQLQQQKMEGQFDMAAALREGHVRVSVSQAVADSAETPSKNSVSQS